MGLYFVTGNTKKFDEAKLFLADLQQLAVDLPEIQSLDSQEIISRKLQAAISKFPGKKFIVEDTSLVFHARNSLPGPFIKWYFDSVGDQGIWKMIEGFADKKASAICTIGYSDGDTIEFFQGITTGIVVEPLIHSDFGRDALFQPDGYDRSYAQMSKEEKNAVSHRGKAFSALLSYLGS